MRFCSAFTKMNLSHSKSFYTIQINHNTTFGSAILDNKTIKKDIQTKPTNHFFHKNFEQKKKK